MHEDFVKCVFHTTDSPENKSSCFFHSKSFTVLILEHSCARNQQTHFSPVVNEKPNLWLEINHHRPWFDKIGLMFNPGCVLFLHSVL